MTLEEQYKKETGQDAMCITTYGIHCVGFEVYRFDYVKWLEEKASRDSRMLSDVQELCKKTIDSARKLSEFGGGVHCGHNVACNYQREYDGKTFCNCGVSDLIYGAKLAEKIKEHIG